MSEKTSVVFHPYGGIGAYTFRMGGNKYMFTWFVPHVFPGDHYTLPTHDWITCLSKSEARSVVGVTAQVLIPIKYEKVPEDTELLDALKSQTYYDRIE